MSTSSSSPAGVAEAVVDGLEVVDVDEDHRTTADRRRARRPTRSANRDRLARSVRGSCDAWWVQLALQLLHPPDGLPEPVVLQRHAGVVGERLEQLEVVGENRSTTPDGLPSIIAPIQPRSPFRTANIPSPKSRDSRYVRASRPSAMSAIGHGAEPWVSISAAELPRRSRGRCPRAPPPVRSRGRSCAAHRPLRREEDDLRDLGSERLERLGEQTLERRADLAAQCDSVRAPPRTGTPAARGAGARRGTRGR